MTQFTFTVNVQAHTREEALAWLSNALLEHADRRHNINRRVRDRRGAVERAPVVQVRSIDSARTLTIS